MAVGDAHVFTVFLTPVPKQLFFPKPATTFLTCFCMFSEQVENTVRKGEIARYEQFLLFPQCFQKTYTADT